MSFLSVCDMGFPCVTANTVTHMQLKIYSVCARKVNILWISSLLDLLLLLVYWQKTQNIHQTQAWRVVQKWREDSLFFSHGVTTPSGPGPPHYWCCTITLIHTTFGRITLEEWSDRHRDLCLTTHNTRKRQTSMPQAGFEPINPEKKRPTHVLHRATTGVGE